MQNTLVRRMNDNSKGADERTRVYGRYWRRRAALWFGILDASGRPVFAYIYPVLVSLLSVASWSKEDTYDILWYGRREAEGGGGRSWCQIRVMFLLFSFSSLFLLFFFSFFLSFFLFSRLSFGLILVYQHSLKAASGSCCMLVALVITFSRGNVN